MNGFKKAFAVMFAVWAVMLMSVTVFADEELPEIQNVRIEGEYYKWDAVEGAAKYSLALYGYSDDLHEPCDTYYDTISDTQINIEEWIHRCDMPTGKYYLSIHAKDSEGNYVSKNRVTGDIRYQYTNENGRLATPQNLRLDGAYLRWDAVENATQYQIYVDRHSDKYGTTHWVTGQTRRTNEYDILAQVMKSQGEKAMYFSKEYTYSFRVIAYDETLKYAYSHTAASEKFSGNKPVITVQPESISAENGETVTFHIEATPAESVSYEWFIADADLGQPLDWSRFDAWGYNTNNLSIRANIDFYNKTVWCRVYKDDVYTLSDYADIEILSSDEAIFTRPLEDVSILAGGTAEFYGAAAYAYDGYDWRFSKGDTNYTLEQLKEICTVYQPFENRLVFTNVPASLDGLELDLTAYNDEGGNAFSGATLTVHENCEFASTTMEYTAFYGDTIRLTVPITTSGYTYTWTVTSGLVDGTLEKTTTVPRYNLKTTKLDPEQKATVKLQATNSNGITRAFYINLSLIYKQGDIDGNGKIENTDAALYLKHLNGNTAYQFTAEQLKRADVNYDGKYDMLDVIAILNKTA